MPDFLDSTPESFILALERTGFLEKGKPVPGLLTPEVWDSGDQKEKYFRYSPVLDHEGLNAAAIFELAGSPCIYFVTLQDSHLSPDLLHHLHRVAWNHGLAPMLWVVTPTRVLIYNAYSRPTEHDLTGPDRHLLDVFEQTARGLARLNEFAGRLQLETGAFWTHRNAQSIDRRHRVDASLLSDLAETERQLRDAGLPAAAAQSLLGRSIFVSYLADRKIVSRDFLANRFGGAHISDIFASKARVLDLFDWVGATFNGDLFPLDELVENQSSERDLLAEPHLEILRAFLTGTEMKNGQGRLWPYDFNFIPVELISSIYEMFAHSADPEEAKERSTHYTPLNLVDLVLSQVTPGLHPQAKVLDMSCGSGVFLVESLRRLVARRIAAGEEWNRDLVRDTLYGQIYGIDLSEGAIRLAAFSLYLTALELDPHPEPLDALKFKPLIGSNLFVADAFDEEAVFNGLEPFVVKGFDAIIGNPPWTRSALGSSASEYCSHPSRAYPRARKSQDQAFLWRSGDFARDDARIGLILAAKPFFATAPAAIRAKKALLTRYSPEILINLSELRQQRVFPTAIAPAMILIARASESKATDQVTFVSVDFDAAYGKHGIIVIGPENVKVLPATRVASDPDLLKIATWGTARDLDVVDRLCSKNPELRYWVEKHQWPAGQGFQKAGGKELASSLAGKKWLPSGEMPRFEIKTGDLKELPEVGMHRPRDPRIYTAPLVLTNRGIGPQGFVAAYANEDVVFTELYYGIAFPRSEERWAHYLNAILNSSLATYFLFLTGSTWGIERDEVKPEDVVRIPIPDPDKAPRELVQRIVDLEFRLRGRLSEAELDELPRDLNAAVFQLYGLSETDQILIRDQVEVVLDYRMRRQRSLAVSRPTPDALARYAQRIVEVLNPFLAVSGRALAAEIVVVPDAPLQVVNLRLVRSSSLIESVTNNAQPGLQDVLSRISEQLPAAVSRNLSIRRNLRIYTTEMVTILKPAELRFWTEAAGVADADAILAEHMAAT